MKKIVIVLLLCFCTLLFGCNEKKQKEEFILEYSYYYDQNNIDSDWDWFNVEEFKNALELNRVIALDFKELKKKIESKESFVIYYGFNPTLYQCPYCAECLPIAINAFDELDIDIYYLDIYAMRANNTDEYLYIYNQLLASDSSFGEKILAPTYVSYKEGNPYKYQIATFKNEDGRFISGITDEQKQQLKNIYQELVK